MMSRKTLHARLALRAFLLAFMQGAWSQTPVSWFCVACWIALGIWDLREAYLEKDES